MAETSEPPKNTIKIPEAVTDEDKLLEETTQKLNKLQDLLNNDQILEFIELTRKVPTGSRPKTKIDVDKITTILYKEMPPKWPKDLKKKIFITLNEIRVNFELPPFKDNTKMIIGLISLFLVLFGLLCYLLFKGY